MVYGCDGTMLDMCLIWFRYGYGLVIVEWKARLVCCTGSRLVAWCNMLMIMVHDCCMLYYAADLEFGTVC